MSVNKVILVGNVGKDPEVRHLEGGTTVARFPLATNETYTDKSGKKVTQTEWHNIVLWRNLAEIAEKYVKSGQQLYIEGKLKTTSYDDKDGNKRYTTNIVAETFRFLGSKAKSDDKSDNNQSAPAESSFNPATFEPTDDLPF